MLSCKPAHRALFTEEKITSLPSVILKNVIFSEFCFNAKEVNIWLNYLVKQFSEQVLCQLIKRQNKYCVLASPIQGGFNMLFRFVFIMGGKWWIIMGWCHLFWLLPSAQRKLFHFALSAADISFLRCFLRDKGITKSCSISLQPETGDQKEKPSKEAKAVRKPWWFETLLSLRIFEWEIYENK